jgi:ABC-2 type transport system permease protein
MQVIFILWLRHLKHFWRSKSRVITALVQPILFLSALGFGLTPIFQRAGHGSYFQFIAPGVVGMSILFSAVATGGELIWDRQLGFLKVTLVAPVSRAELMIGRTLGGATIASAQGVIVILLCFLIGYRSAGFSVLPKALLYMILSSLLFTALGITVACLVSDFQGFQVVTNFLLQPMFLLSGALYPLGSISKVLLWIARVDPFAYGVDGIRGTLAGNSGYFGLYTDALFLGIASLALLGLGVYLFSRLRS